MVRRQGVCGVVGRVRRGVVRQHAGLVCRDGLGGARWP